jgi:hypothetical protein
MEAVHTSETSVNFNVTTRCYISEDFTLHIRRRENMKSHIINNHFFGSLYNYVIGFNKMLITKRNTSLIEKVRVAQLVQKHPVSYGTQRFIIVLTTATCLMVPSATWVPSTEPQSTRPRSVLPVLTTEHSPSTEAISRSSGQKVWQNFTKAYA